MPRVTVCIPTRNRARWLPGAIESVLGQTFQDFVLLVSDNASTDATPDVVAGFSDPRIDYTRQDTDIGLVGNHNRLLERVETDYVIILPDDDVMHERLLERTVPVLDRHPMAGMVHTRFDMIGEHDETLASDVNWTYGLSETTIESGAEFLRESLEHSCRVCASTALMRTSALPEGFFLSEHFPPVDFSLWLRMARNWDMAYLDETLGRYRVHGGSHSAALGSPYADGYMQDVGLIAKLRELKRAWVAAHGSELGDIGELRRRVRAGSRHEALMLARAKTLPAREFRPTLAALATSVRFEPTLLLDIGAWKLLGGSMLGRRLTERLLGSVSPSRRPA